MSRTVLPGEVSFDLVEMIDECGFFDGDRVSPRKFLASVIQTFGYFKTQVLVDLIHDTNDQLLQIVFHLPHIGIIETSMICVVTLLENLPLLLGQNRIHPPEDFGSHAFVTLVCPCTCI